MYVHSKKFILCVSILKTTKAIASVKWNYFDTWERTHCENMFTCYYFFTWYKTGCSLWNLVHKVNKGCGSKSVYFQRIASI